jgi:putative transposase
MPNHVHAIMLLSDHDTVQQTVPALAQVVAGYKSGVTRRIRQQASEPIPVWQARYHDHIIRDERGLHKIREYVLHNPALWQQDTFYDEP